MKILTPAFPPSVTTSLNLTQTTPDSRTVSNPLQAMADEPVKDCRRCDFVLAIPRLAATD
jgi:hypothetical protein